MLFFFYRWIPSLLLLSGGYWWVLNSFFFYNTFLWIGCRRMNWSFFQYVPGHSRKQHTIFLCWFWQCSKVSWLIMLNFLHMSKKTVFRLAEFCSNHIFKALTSPFSKSCFAFHSCYYYCMSNSPRSKYHSNDRKSYVEVAVWTLITEAYNIALSILSLFAKQDLITLVWMK